MKTILFITISSGVAPSTRVRVSNLIPGLENHGCRSKIVGFPKSIKDKFKLLLATRNHDIVFIQKRMPTVPYARLLRFFSKRMIYDFDDVIYFRPNSPDECIDAEKYRRFKNIIKLSDIVIAGNEILAKEVIKHRNSCEIIPSAVKTLNIPVKDYHETNDPFVIGWVGTEINLTCLESLVPVFQKLARRHPLQLRIISSKSIDVPGVNTLFIPWDEEAQGLEISRFDCGVMPLFDYPHTRGKCAYKALQYMAAGVPPVVSDVGINRHVIEHGKTGFVVPRLDQFEFYIEQLIMNRPLVRSMGEAARTKACKEFSIEGAVQKLVNLLN